MQVTEVLYCQKRLRYLKDEQDEVKRLSSKEIHSKEANMYYPLNIPEAEFSAGYSKRFVGKSTSTR